MYRPSRTAATIVLALQLSSLDLYATGGPTTVRWQQQQHTAPSGGLKPWQWLLGAATLLATTASAEQDGSDGRQLLQVDLESDLVAYSRLTATQTMRVGMGMTVLLLELC